MLAHAVCRVALLQEPRSIAIQDRKSTRLNSSHGYISYAVFCFKKKTTDDCENVGSSWPDILSSLGTQDESSVPVVLLAQNPHSLADCATHPASVVTLP